MLAGEHNPDSIVDRCAQLCGRRWRWLRPLAIRFVDAFDSKPRPRLREVILFLGADDQYQDALTRYPEALYLESLLHPQQRMNPVPAASHWNLPVLESISDLAHWLRLDPVELQWFADLKGLTSKTKNQQLQHYHYRILSKKSGSIRLIEAPKQHLKQIQRQILSEILNRIPAHPAAHGFVPTRSIHTFAAPHVGQHVILRMDLENFFPSISTARVQAALRTGGYPEPVADLLGGLCTTKTPRGIWQRADTIDLAPESLSSLRELYAKRHLPQGAPTSPALANLCFYRADCRLDGLAQSANARYSRYADDLAFSGDAHFAARMNSFSTRAAAILIEEGFQVHHRKTRVMRQGVRQHLAGLVVNQRINTPRADYDRLKAILTNCVHHGPESQNREQHPSFQAHLSGRIAFVENTNAAKGQRLRKVFDRIHW
jgi:RNA-directed DNA polymerase